MSARPESNPASRVSRLWRLCRRHPVASAVFLLGAIAGAGAAVWIPLGPEDMSPLARALGGALAGAWLAMFPLGFRLFE